MTSAALRRLELEGARRRVRRELESAATAGDTVRRQRVVVAVSAVLVALTFAARLAVDDPGALIANFYAIPVTLLAIEFGVRGGIAGSAVGWILVVAWGAIQSIDVGALGYSTRGAVFLVVGLIVGWYAERLPAASALGRASQYELGLRNEELERTNIYLAQTVRRLEAFSEIARAGAELDREQRDREDVEVRDQRARVGDRQARGEGRHEQHRGG